MDEDTFRDYSQQLFTYSSYPTRRSLQEDDGRDRVDARRALSDTPRASTPSHERQQDTCQANKNPRQAAAGEESPQPPRRQVPHGPANPPPLAPTRLWVPARGGSAPASRFPRPCPARPGPAPPHPTGGGIFRGGGICVDTGTPMHQIHHAAAAAPSRICSGVPRPLPSLRASRARGRFCSVPLAPTRCGRRTPRGLCPWPVWDESTWRRRLTDNHDARGAALSAPGRVALTVACVFFHLEPPRCSPQVTPPMPATVSVFPRPAAPAIESGRAAPRAAARRCGGVCRRGHWGARGAMWRGRQGDEGPRGTWPSDRSRRCERGGGGGGGGGVGALVAGCC